MAEKKPVHEQRFKRTDWGIEPVAQTDPLRNPDGIYSGASKRVAIEDGSFAEIGEKPRISGRRRS
jgi:hypothetical protein